ncbi:hypothetical protein [Pseudomonas aeruginosa]|uniref:hypothetical protein n=1 Tax=Pseudomonas aeruginosa TaxID=287 RepID=UPI002231B78D|nr:hypothetical protein [Pseudomonas aeruginosa]HBO0799788.1 hypothetical protein [Pseudomonas aeruginosa]HBO1471922.1 hypothetical protein [Pseudomonas aeruginosa]HBO7099526.1 hypothetical protein [Pseudomonas aeruginosa]HBP5204595.1 hypothetical protein [Pseudomonas aeruginosa]HCF5279432.1 hypothetical protein [Pseudomonas aeruginosa]
MKFSKHLLIMLLSYSVLAVADLEIKSGMYLRVGDGGVFNVFLDKHGDKVFRIRTLGSNGHSCSLGGKVDGSRVIVVGPSYAERCDIEVKNTGSQIELRRSEGDIGCSDYCGPRAGINGRYKLAYSLCTIKSSVVRIKESDALISQGEKRKAYSSLVDLHEKCSEFMDRYARMRLMNKVSVLALELGDKKTCRKVQEDDDFFNFVYPEYLPENLKPEYRELSNEHARLKRECS